MSPTDPEDILALVLERIAAAGVDDMRETAKGWRGSCPHCGRDDRFVVEERRDGDGYWMKCNGHCLPNDVLGVLELTWRDLRVSASEGKVHITELRNPDLAQARAINWAWRQRIPIGKPALNVGNEGVGKGAVTAYLCARWSRGELDGDLKGTPAHVIVVGDEDAVNDTWTPRLHLAGADFAHVHFQIEADGDIDLTEPADVEHLRALIRLAGARVVVFDALLDHIGGPGVDEMKPKAVRGALRPLRRLAAEEDVAVVGTMHPRKGRVVSFRDLIANSHQFNAVSRSSLLLAPHPDDPELRVLAWGKGNHAGLVPTLEFRIEPVTFELPSGRQTTDVRAVDWQETVISIEDAIRSSGGAPRPVQQEARRDAVFDALTGEPQTVRAIATAADVARSTTQRLLEELEEMEEAVRTGDGWKLRAGLSHYVQSRGTGQPAPRIPEPNEAVPSHGITRSGTTSPEGNGTPPPQDDREDLLGDLAQQEEEERQRRENGA